MAFFFFFFELGSDIGSVLIFVLYGIVAKVVCALIFFPLSISTDGVQ